jgi:hypothetical protein
MGVENGISEDIDIAERIKNADYRVVTGFFKKTAEAKILHACFMLKELSDEEYEEVMKYFFEHKDGKPEIAKGFLLKEETKGGFIITQRFLDKDGKIVEGARGRLGYKRKVRRLDGKVLELFKNKNAVLVELQRGVVKEFAGSGVRLGEEVNELSYEEVMQYFFEYKDGKPEIAKGFLLKEETKSGFIITQRFLDKDGKIVEGEQGRLGYTRRVGRLDGKLFELFKNKKAVLVEL